MRRRRPNRATALSRRKQATRSPLALPIQAQYSELAVAVVPLAFSLYNNAPNPFNPATQIRFDLPMSGRVELTVYDMLGQKVRSLVWSSLAAGSQPVEWNGRDANGAQR